MDRVPEDSRGEWPLRANLCRSPSRHGSALRAAAVPPTRGARAGGPARGATRWADFPRGGQRAEPWSDLGRLHLASQAQVWPLSASGLAVSGRPPWATVGFVYTADPVWRLLSTPGERDESRGMADRRREARGLAGLRTRGSDCVAAGGRSMGVGE